jgi:HAE1 family hydrophobic/amphiphilic exporter-1
MERHEKALFRCNRHDAKIIAECNIKSNTDAPEAPASDYQAPSRTGIQNIAAEETRQMLAGGAAVLAGALALLYLVLGTQFESFTLPLLFLLALPPAFSSAFICLFLTGKTLNLHSVIALALLFGIAVNNGIILYENCAKKIADGEEGIDNPAASNGVYCSPEESVSGFISLFLPRGRGMKPSPRITEIVIRSCVEKFRAVLITTGTTVCAMLPFAVDPGNRSDQSALAVVLTGGLAVSTALVLVVFPVIFARHFHRKKRYPCRLVDRGEKSDA